MIRHLLFPGILGPAPEPAGALPSLPGLEALLARADRLEGPAGFADAAFALFERPRIADADLPSAALCYAYQTGTVPDRWVLHADPVHLRADRDSLLLFDADVLDVHDEEAAACERAFNSHFGDEGLRLYAASARHWYLLSDADPAVSTSPLDDVNGRDIDAYLPNGRRQHAWRQRLNEVQMLFHGLDLNQAREAGGEPTINGVWFSGGGRMPDRGTTTIGRVEGRSLLVSALAGHADVVGHDQLCVDDSAWRALLHADRQAWEDALLRIDDSLDDHLADAEICWLHCCNGVSYRWRASMRRRFWRRRQPLDKLLKDV